MNRRKQLLADAEHKPRFRLAKISQKRGYQDWLDKEGLKVSDIWGYYLYDEAEVTHLCSLKGSYWMEPIVAWYEVDSLQDTSEERRDLSDFMDDAGNDPVLALQYWFEGQLEDSFDIAGFYVDGVDCSIPVVDAGRWLSCVGNISAVVEKLANPECTIDEAWSQVKSDLLELCSSGAGGDEIHSLFNRPLDEGRFNRISNLLSSYSGVSFEDANKFLLWNGVTASTIAAPIIKAEGEWKEEAIARVLSIAPDVSEARQQYIPVTLSGLPIEIDDWDTQNLISSILSGYFWLEGVGQVDILGASISKSMCPSVSLRVNVSRVEEKVGVKNTVKTRLRQDFPEDRAFINSEGDYVVASSRPSPPEEWQLLPEQVGIVWHDDQSANEILVQWARGRQPDDILDTTSEAKFLKEQGYLDDLVNYYF